jgi:hypothetical protein
MSPNAMSGISFQLESRSGEGRWFERFAVRAHYWFLSHLSSPEDCDEPPLGGRKQSKHEVYPKPNSFLCRVCISLRSPRRFLRKLIAMTMDGFERKKVWACDRASVPRYSPHDFRHTFAVNFFRNYPNIYALQQMLGHSTLDVVKRYLAISESDVAEAHKHASPVENWGS